MSALLTVAATLALAVDPACGAAPVGSELALRLVASATRESGRDPLAINVNGPGGGSQRFTTKEAAIAYARRLQASGVSWDAGLLQINNANFARHGLTLETAFDACASMRAGAAHLQADLNAVWRAAHGRYNTGRIDGNPAYSAEIERALAAVRRELNAPAATAPPSMPAAPACAPSWDVWARCRPAPPPQPVRHPPTDASGIEAAPAAPVMLRGFASREPR